MIISLSVSVITSPFLFLFQTNLLCSIMSFFPDESVHVLPVLFCRCNYVHPPGGWIYYFCFFRRPMSDVRRPVSGVRRPMSGVTHGFRSFKGKVLELLSPNLVCRLIGSVACLGLLLAVVPLLLTE